MTCTKGLLILGFGGHARSVADVALSAGAEQLLFVDEQARVGEEFLGFSVLREFSGPLPKGWACLSATGNNQKRKRQLEQAVSAGWPLTSVLSPRATIGVGASISPGCFVAHHAHIGPMAKVGVGCIINTGAIIDHECVVGDYAHISINASLAGRCSIGNFVFLGAGSAVIDGIAIADGVTIGAGGVVIKNIDQPGTYVGIPVKMISKTGASI